MPISDEHTVTDLAWAAGFIDGDGVISVYQRTDRNRGFSVVVRAMNTNRLALEKLHSMFGGTIHVMTKANNTHGWKPSFYWAASDRTAEVAIRGLLPFLLLKRPQAELALEARSFVDPVGRGKRNESQLQSLKLICNQFRELNMKGRVATSDI